MNEIKFYKFMKIFYEIFPRKDETYIMFNNIEYILSLKNLNYEKVELSFLNPETLMKYHKILTFSDIIDLKIRDQNTINNKYISYNDIVKDFFDKININNKSNKIQFKIFENIKEKEIKFNFFFFFFNINSDIIIEKIKIEYEDIYFILFK